MELEGKAAIVTGAGQGIGEASARLLAEHGAAVLVADVNDAAGERVAAEIEAAGGRAVYAHADVSERAQVERLLAIAERELGRLDVLHNNAAVNETALTERPSSLELEEEVWDRVLDVNLRGTWLCSKLAAPLLAADGGGAIVNAASIGGLVGYPMVAAYGASKAAIVQLTRVMAVELAPLGVRVNCYSPGNTDTPMVNRYFEAAPPAEREALRREFVATQLVPRMAEPREIAELVLYLGGPRSAFVNGANVVIDGGTLAWRGSA